MPTGTAQIVSFRGTSPNPTVDHPRPDRLVRGNPARTTWDWYTDPTERVYAGEWACEPGAWRIEVAENQVEVCTLLSGRVRLTDDSGASVEHGPGETFVVPAGFRGTWDTLEALKKTYVIVLL